MRRWIPIAAVAWLAAAPAGAHLPGAGGDHAHRPTVDVEKDKNAYMIGYAHLDTQWRWTYVDVIRDYIPKTFHDNFALFEKYPDYVFNFTGSRRYRMMKEYYPADYAKMTEYIRKGRWYPTGSSVDENDANVPSWESHIRNTLYGNRYFEKDFGIYPVDFILPDCFGFPASLPSILAHLGAKGFSTQKLTWGSAAGVPFTVGVWEGPDGKSVVAALDGGSYTSRVSEDLSQSQFLLGRINKVGDRSGAYVDYRYFGTGDTGGAPTDDSVKWIQESLAGKGPVKVISGPADQLFLDLQPQHIEKMERYKGDLELTEHSAGSLTSQSYMKRWNRKNELLADAAERASVAATWLGALPYPQDKLTHAWELVLGSQMHDILPGTSLPKAYEFSWNDEVVALNAFASTLQSAVGAVARGLDTRAKGVPIVVYNPLSIQREDVVEAVVRFPAAAPASVRVFGPNGEVPSQVLSRQGNAVRVLFLAKVPSVGLAAYDVRPAGAYKSANTLQVSRKSLENARYRVTLNDNGDVAQVYDKAARRNLLSGPARLAFKLDEPREWPAWNMDWDDQSAPPTGYVTGPATIRVVESGPVRVALEVTRHSQGSRFVQRIQLAAGGAGDRLEFDNDIQWNTRRHNLKAEFPLAVANEKATYNLGLGTIERTNNDPKKYEVVSHQWFDLTDASGDYGVSVLEDSKYGSDKPDDKTLRLTLLRTPGARSYPDQSTQDLGRHEMLYALSGHAGDWRKGRSQWEAARLNQPLRAFQTTSHPGALGASTSLFRVSTDQVAIAAIKKAEDNDEIIVRLSELNGAPANGVRLAASVPIVSAREVDGQERPIGAARIENGAIVVNMTAYNPRAFALKLAAPKARIKAPTSRPIALKYDVVAASRDKEKTKIGFDGAGNAISADLMPTSLKVGGISFRLAPGGQGRKSAMAARGQKIALPGGNLRNVYLLASSIRGDQRGTFQVDGKPVTLTVQDWSGFIGQWDNRVWAKPNTPGAERLEGGIYGLRPAYIKRDPIAWVGEHRHKADGSNDIYAYSYIFQYHIPVPAGAKTLTLPNNPNIRVFAISAADNAGEATRPALPLYDTFNTPETAVTIGPEVRTFRDSIEVAVRPSLYLTNSKLHYTTDGSVPTASSPVYRAPFMLTRTSNVKVRAIGAGGKGGPVASAIYSVNDITSPSVRKVVAVDGSRLVRVTFSEPLEAASAARPASYRIAPDLTVRSVALSGDGRSVDLTLAAPPKAGTAYTLSLQGLKDRSPAGNPVASAARGFTVAAPVFHLTASASGQPVVGGETAPESVQVIGAPRAASWPNGPALALNGTEDALVVADRPELNPTSAITLAAWVRPEDWTGNRRIVQKGRQDSQYRLLAEFGRLKLDIAGVGAVTAPLPRPGAWHHIAGTYDGAMLRLFVDGAEVAREEADGPLPTSTDALYVGTRFSRRRGDSSSAPPGDHFRGEISDVRVYDDALTAGHIRALASR